MDDGAQRAASDIAVAVLERQLASVVDELRASRAREAALASAADAADERVASEARAVAARYESALRELAGENAELATELRRAVREVEKLRRAEAQRRARADA